MPTDSYYLRAAEVRQRYGGVSDMWIWRNLNDTHSTFPKPRYFGRRRFWLLSDLIEWETAQAGKSTGNQSSD